MPRRILLVEDNPTLLVTLYNLLTDAGYRVCVALDAAAALASVVIDRPDLLLVDADLPDISGLTLAYRLRATEGQGTHLPVVLLTGGVPSALPPSTSLVAKASAPGDLLQLIDRRLACTGGD